MIMMTMTIIKDHHAVAAEVPVVARAEDGMVMRKNIPAQLEKVGVIAIDYPEIWERYIGAVLSVPFLLRRTAGPYREFPFGNITLSGCFSNSATIDFIRRLLMPDAFLGCTRYVTDTSSHVFGFVLNTTNGYSFMSSSSTGVCCNRSLNLFMLFVISSPSSFFAVFLMTVST